MSERIVEFLRKKDFVLERELGHGACGKTVILYDPLIDQRLVCKKYAPHEALKEELFGSFQSEIKLLYQLNHPNVVRVFNYYLYPDHFAGYILMELIDGPDIEAYLLVHPEHANQIFVQVVNGFMHLESHGILHRDIRPQNILVANGGVTKIIDFGFGKKIISDEDFDKSISLNWWCETPADFGTGTYDFRTEVYFIGKLFEKIIVENDISDFAYKHLLTRMCARSAVDRIESFSKVNQEVQAGRFEEIRFSEEDLLIYRSFADELSAAISKIERGAKYRTDSNDIERKLSDAFRKVMLEENVPANNLITSCFLDGPYYYSKVDRMTVETIRHFLELWRSCSLERKNLILSNLHTRFDTIKRYDNPSDDFDDDIPF